MKKVMDSITRVTDKICYYVCYLSMFVVALMMTLIFVDVILGQVFTIRIKGCYEISQVALSILVFSSWAYTQTQHGHIHVVMFVSKMPRLLRFFCFGITSLASTIIVGYSAYAVFNKIFDVYQSNEATGTLMIPYWPFYIFEFVAFALLTIVLLTETIKSFAAMFSHEFAEEVQSTWV